MADSNGRRLELATPDAQLTHLIFSLKIRNTADDDIPDTLVEATGRHDVIERRAV
jgi:hypothetical protein